MSGWDPWERFPLGNIEVKVQGIVAYGVTSGTKK